MKLENVVFAILLLKMCIIFGQETNIKKVIIIDPGHGGKDTGAIGINKLKEKEVVLNIAKEIIKLNRTLLNNEFDIYLTRYTDTLISLSDRTRLATALKTDIFISLHCNASSMNSSGIEVYVHNSKKPNTNTSIELGTSIINQSTQKLGFKKRGIKFNNFQVLREMIPEIPAVLVEMGFITNHDESNHYIKAKNIKAMALAILLGINNYLKQEL